MFRPTQALGKKFRKLRLTTKDINKGFYKGNRTGNMGSHDKWGGFTIEFEKVRTYAVPAGLDTFKVRGLASLAWIMMPKSRADNLRSSHLLSPRT